jgi:hypothetical protein
MRRLMLGFVVTLALVAGFVSNPSQVKAEKRCQFVCGSCLISEFWALHGTACDVLYKCIHFPTGQAACLPSQPGSPNDCMLQSGELILAIGFLDSECADVCDLPNECHTGLCYMVPGKPTLALGPVSFMTPRKYCVPTSDPPVLP